MSRASYPEASPLKWHLGRTTWFWAQFILKDNLPENYNFLFNSYYNSVGARTNRAKRGFKAGGVCRKYWLGEDVDEKVGKLLSSEEQMPELFEIAIQHEKQHQELMLMDLQLNFFLMDVQPTAFTGKTSKFMNPDKTLKFFLKPFSRVQL